MKTTLYILYTPSIKLLIIIFICGIVGEIGNSFKESHCNLILKHNNLVREVVSGDAEQF